MATKVLITGSCGFLCSNLVIYALQETDWNMVSIDKLTWAGSLLNVPQVRRHKLYLGDLCDEHLVQKILEVEQPEVVIHGATESCIDRGANFIKTNVGGTNNILQAALECKSVKRVLNLSTCEVYGNLATGSATEGSVLNPRNPYASSKAAADLIGQSYFNTYGLPVITIRCADNFGPRQNPSKLIPKVVYQATRNEQVQVFGAGKQTRDWIYVKDSFNAIKLLVERGQPGEVYNISAGQTHTNLEVISSVLKTLNKPESLLEFAPGIDCRYSADATKLNTLGWKPQYSFDEALQHTIGWLGANGSWFWRAK